MWDSLKVAQILNGELQGSPHAKVWGGAIDSRLVKDETIFFALLGEKVDGHDYLEAAWENGASICLGEKERLQERDLVQIPQGKALITVDSTLEAIQQLAKVRSQELGAKVVGITGSNGKTTTKDMVAGVLAQKYRVHKNLENQNNELGLPLTILNAPKDTEVLVLEMGMRGLGQIAFLCTIAQPDLGVITNIGTTHMELLGSQENIARAKWELIEALPAEGRGILNGDDEWSVKLAQERDRHFFYGLAGKYHQPNLQGDELTPWGVLGTEFLVKYEDISSGQRVKLPLPGEHNVLDALAALSVGFLMGIPLQEGARGLEGMELSPMRLELQNGLNNATLISDVYNANPASMKASLKVLKERGGSQTLAILGDMYELGEGSLQGHYDVGQEVANLEIKELIAVGPLAQEIARGAKECGMTSSQITSVEEREEAIAKARQILANNPETWVLIKASRGMKMEEVTKALHEGLEKRKD